MSFPPNFREPPPGYPQGNGSNQRHAFLAQLPPPPPTLPPHTFVPPPVFNTPPPNVAYPPQTYPEQKSSKKFSTYDSSRAYQRDKNTYRPPAYHRNDRDYRQPPQSSRNLSREPSSHYRQSQENYDLHSSTNQSRYDNNSRRDYRSRSEAPHLENTRRYPRERSVPVEKSFAKEESKSTVSKLEDELGKSAATERERILANWRKNFCETTEDITRKLAELTNNNDDREYWIRSSPADIYYRRVENSGIMQSTPRLDTLCSLFEEELLKRGDAARGKQPPFTLPARKQKPRLCKHKSEKCSSSESSEEDDINLEEDCTMEELTRKIQHPYRLHTDLWYNDTGEMNDGPLCRCSARSRRTGIRHSIYPGENGFTKCDPNTNNSDKLYHYRITISPPTNFLTKTPTIIKYDQHEFIFEGFSLFAHVPIDELPTCKVIRFNIEYTILYIEEKMPENFTIRELDSFHHYLFNELLELIDFTLMPPNKENVCPCFHFLPRFVRDLPDNGKEVLAMSEVLRYLLDNSRPLVDHQTLKNMMRLNQHEWQDYVDNIKGMVVCNPGMKPCSVRVDQLDRNVSDMPECKDTAENDIVHPVIVHFGIRPPQLSYAGNPEYQKAWREYVKFRHLVANMSKPSYEDKRKLEAKENKLQEMRMQGRMKRNITVAVSSKGFHRTGVMCDIIQHAMLIPVLTGHLRFHRSLNHLEQSIGYSFQNRYLLQLALTHPSYKENFGTNPDHARNSLTNCGIRQPKYGDRKIHFMNTRKRGINTLINIMSRFGKENETDSNITHNERLEFLGDAVVEFLTSIHLFFMFPDLEEGGLATYRAAIVQNQHLAVLAKKLCLEEYMLYAHGSDLCHELELRHAMANCFEALMGALLLDGGIDVADKVFGAALFQENDNLKEMWINYPPHPLQEQEPLGDRQWIESYQLLKDLTKFEETIGVEFRHIRLLARSFTDRSIGFTHLTLGSNQRLEFLGDTVLQLICSEFLYRHFPEHHEGHLSLLRSSLVNNRTQAVVCDDLGMTQYAVYSNPKAELKTKDRADLLEAFLGALYVDQGLDYCQTFCHVCLFPRLQDFIMNQDWNDPKSKLQQCCLTLRTMDGGEPDIPVYKVIECIGPTNTRVYTVAVYFRGTRLACATGHSIQQAEMNAAKNALENSNDLFPQLDHQKRVIAQSIKRQRGNGREYGGDRDDGMFESNSGRDEQQVEGKNSNLPMQYRPKEDDDFTIVSDSTDDDVQFGSPPTNLIRKHRKRRKDEKKRTDQRSQALLDDLACSPVTDDSSTNNDDIDDHEPSTNGKSVALSFDNETAIENTSLDTVEMVDDSDDSFSDM